jgi:glycerate-2-kinase
MEFKKIQNFKELAMSDSRRVALEIAEAGLQAVDTEHIVKELVRVDGSELHVGKHRFELGKGRVVVIGVGKCALQGARVLEEKLGDRITEGVVLHIGQGAPLKRIEAIEGTHPFPSDKNIQGAKRIVEVLADISEEDVVIFLISGGSSTLLCLPETAGCVEEEMILRELMRAGAPISEINTVRKHLSRARGGHLAMYAYPARAVALIFSDVPGDDLQFIASGPTVKDATTVEEAKQVLEKYNVLAKCNLENVEFIETPKDEKYFERVTNIVVVSNTVALEAMARKAKEEGLSPIVCDRCLAGEAREMGLHIARELHKAPPGTVLLYGGETTVAKKRPSGRGGRNLELALAATQEIKEDELIAAVSSDGRDNGPFAGALGDMLTREALLREGIDVQAVLEKHDTYPAFRQAGHYLVTGDTGSNVSDLIIALKK